MSADQNCIITYHMGKHPAVRVISFFFAIFRDRLRKDIAVTADDLSSDYIFGHLLDSSVMRICNHIFAVHSHKINDITDQHQKHSHKDIRNLKNLPIGLSLFLRSFFNGILNSLKNSLFLCIFVFLLLLPP